MIWPLAPNNEFDVADIARYERIENKHDFFIDNYDYNTAEIILGNIRGLNSFGPYIVAYRAPLSEFQDDKIFDEEMLIVDLTRVSKDSFEDVLKWYKQKVTDDPKSWKNHFDWELMKIHLKDALLTHGEPILLAVEWTGKFFDVKEAFAKPIDTKLTE